MAKRCSTLYPAVVHGLPVLSEGSSPLWSMWKVGGWCISLLVLERMTVAVTRRRFSVHLPLSADVIVAYLFRPSFRSPAISQRPGFALAFSNPSKDRKYYTHQALADRNPPLGTTDNEVAGPRYRLQAHFLRSYHSRRTGDLSQEIPTAFCGI